MIEITIPGAVHPHKLPARWFTCPGPQESALQAEIGRQYGGEALGGLVHLQIEVYCTPPARASKKRRAAMLADEIPVVRRPVDGHLLRYVLEVGSRALWVDGCQIASAMVTHQYGEEAKTVVRVYPVQGKTTLAA